MPQAPTLLNQSLGLGIDWGSWGDGGMKITVELRTEPSHHNDYIARLPGETAVLSEMAGRCLSRWRLWP
jgi:hypothetical protein